MEQLLKNTIVFQLAVFPGDVSRNADSVVNPNALLNETGFADV